MTDPNSEDFRNVTTLRGTLVDGSVLSVLGTLTGPRMVEKIVGINGFDLEVPVSEHMAFFAYTDLPGVVGGHALVVLNVDSQIPAAVLDEITLEIGATSSTVVDLED